MICASSNTCAECFFRLKRAQATHPQQHAPCIHICCACKCVRALQQHLRGLVGDGPTAAQHGTQHAARHFTHQPKGIGLQVGSHQILCVLDLQTVWRDVQAHCQEHVLCQQASTTVCPYCCNGCCLVMLCDYQQAGGVQPGSPVSIVGQALLHWVHLLLLLATCCCCCCAHQAKVAHFGCEAVCSTAAAGQHHIAAAQVL